MDFIAAHLFEIVTLGSSLVISLVTLGVFKQRFITLEGKVNRMDAMGTVFNRENSIKFTGRLDTLERRTQEIENNFHTVTNLLYEIRTAVKVIEAKIQDKPGARH